MYNFSNKFMPRIITSFLCILLISADCISHEATCYKSSKRCRDVNSKGFSHKFTDILTNQDQGMIASGREIINDSMWHVVVAKFTDKGIPDPAFGVNGIARSLSGHKSEGYALAVTETNIFVA